MIHLIQTFYAWKLKHKITNQSESLFSVIMRHYLIKYSCHNDVFSSLFSFPDSFQSSSVPSHKRHILFFAAYPENEFCYLTLAAKKKSAISGRRREQCGSETLFSTMFLLSAGRAINFCFSPPALRVSRKTKEKIKGESREGRRLGTSAFRTRAKAPGGDASENPRG